MEWYDDLIRWIENRIGERTGIYGNGSPFVGSHEFIGPVPAESNGTVENSSPWYGSSLWDERLMGLIILYIVLVTKPWK